MISFLQAFQSIRQQGNRTWLAALGVMVGTVAILLLISIAKGVQADVSGEVRDLGVNLLIVLPGRIEGEGFNPNLAGQSYLREPDVDAVEQVHGVLRATPLTFAGGGASYQERRAYPVNIAVRSTWFSMHKTDLQEGRVFQEADDRRPVCILGGLAKQALFPSESALGKEVKINGRTYQVIGVTQKKKSGSSLFAMFSFENVVYVPYEYVKQGQTNMQIDRIMIQTAPDVEPKGLKDRIDAVLGKRLDHQQYSVLTQDDLLGLVFKLMNILTWLVTGLTSIAVFVGGIGIMTSMLMSVNERTKEIGIRKTVGATRRQIFRQFLLEAVMVTLMGGFVGLVLSWMVALVLTKYTPIKPLFSGDVFAIAFGVGIGLGSFFGVVPALAAARKDPITALRTE